MFIYNYNSRSTQQTPKRHHPSAFFPDHSRRKERRKNGYMYTLMSAIFLVRVFKQPQSPPHGHCSLDLRFKYEYAGCSSPWPCSAVAKEYTPNAAHAGMARNVTVRHLFISAVVVCYHQHHRRDGWYLREREIN